MTRLSLVFDLDGTLVDSAGSLAAATGAMLAEMGRELLDVATVSGFVGHAMAMLVERALRATGGVPEAGVGPALARFEAIYGAGPVTGVAVHDGVRETLGRLRAQGHGIAVCTQKPEAVARRLLVALDLMPPVSGLTGGDTVGALKPDPRLVEHAAAQLGPGRVVFVGDSEVDAATARNAGVPFVLYRDDYRHGPLAAIARDGDFADFAELPALLSRLPL